MIVAIYLVENPGVLPVNPIVPITKVEKVSRDRREHERRHPAFSETLSREIAKRSDNYDSSGQFVETEQLFNRLA